MASDGNSKSMATPSIIATGAVPAAASGVGTLLKTPAGQSVRILPGRASPTLGTSRTILVGADGAIIAPSPTSSGAIKGPVNPPNGATLAAATTAKAPLRATNSFVRTPIRERPESPSVATPKTASAASSSSVAVEKSGASPAPKNVKEFSVRVRKMSADSNVLRKYQLMKFHASQKMDVAKWKTVQMAREDNKKVFKASSREEEPRFGAGSEYGKDAKEEARRKKYGYASRKYNPEDQPWLLQEGGPGGRKFRGVRDGGVTQNTSYYVFQQAGAGAFEAFPLQSWYGFTPSIKYNYLKEEEAEDEFTKRGKIMSRFSTMIRKRMKDEKEDDDADDEDDAGGATKRQGKDKQSAKKKKGKKEFNLTEMDDWVDDSDDDASDGSDADGGKKRNDDDDDDFTGKKKKGKKGAGGKKAKKKTKKKKGDDSEEEISEGEESDDGDFEGREEDYITDSSGGEEPDAQEEKAREELKGVDQEEEEEEEESEEEEKKKDEEKGKKSKEGKEGKEKGEGEEEGSDSSSDEESHSDSDVEKDSSALFMKKKKKNSSNESSRAPTPSGDAAAADGANRKRKRDTEESPVKRVKNLVNKAANGAAESSAPGASQSPPFAVIQAAEKEGLTEEDVRKYLKRKPLTTKDLLAKFKKKTSLTPQQLVQLMAHYLRRINPMKETVNGKTYWSLSKQAGGGGDDA